MCIKMIVGLGNNEKSLLKTRHNIGFWFINFFLIKEKKKKKIKDIYEIFIKNKKIFFYMPNSYINESGKYIFFIKNKLNIKNNELLIVHDDLDLKPGQAKIKKGIGKICSHNGVKNFVKYINNKNNFYRLRIGIGKPYNKNNKKKFVLSEPSKKEKLLIYKSIKKSFYCIKK